MPEKSLTNRNGLRAHAAPGEFLWRHAFDEKSDRLSHHLFQGQAIPGVPYAKITYPKGQIFKPNFSPDGIAVYEASVEITAELQKGEAHLSRAGRLCRLKCRSALSKSAWGSLASSGVSEQLPSSIHAIRRWAHRPLSH
jgi:hypothetical protein